MPVALTVEEAAGTYERAMRNPLAAGVGVCSICHTFIDPRYSSCYRCSREAGASRRRRPDHLQRAPRANAHSALRTTKTGSGEAQNYATPRLAAILWLFLEQHEGCVARATGARGSAFDLVRTVPSSTRDRDDRRGNLRWIVGTGCKITAAGYERVLPPRRMPLRARVRPGAIRNHTTARRPRRAPD